MRKVKLDKILDTISKGADPTGVLIYIVVLGLFLLSYFVLVLFLELN